jgi:hypothetical protein
VVAQVYNPSYLGGVRWERGGWRPGQQKTNKQTKKLARFISTNKKLGVVVFTRHPSYAESINRIIVQE